MKPNVKPDPANAPAEEILAMLDAFARSRPTPRPDPRALATHDYRPPAPFDRLAPGCFRRCVCPAAE